MQNSRMRNRLLRTIPALLENRRLILTRLSIFKDIFFVAGKSVIGIIPLSFFMFANALYSAGLGLARFVAVKMHTQTRKKQLTGYRQVGIIISVTGICYVLYSARLFFGGKTGTYSLYVALVIALYTFVEFGINIREAFRLRRSEALDARALRAISFASTLICFVLTQTAILSFTAEGDTRIFNAIAGVTFGSLAASIGLYVIADSVRRQRASIPE